MEPTKIMNEGDRDIIRINTLNDIVCDETAPLAMRLNALNKSNALICGAGVLPLATEADLNDYLIMDV